MSNKKIIYDNLPSKIRSLLILSEGWLVGSSPNCLIEGNSDINDYDIMIEDRSKFMLTVNFLKSISNNLVFNSFGGVKANVDGYKIDIWCESLDHFLKNASYVNYIYSIKHYILLKNEF